jgi:DNA helicase-2/ATP-dependent DNA helicase PcrA
LENLDFPVEEGWIQVELESFRQLVRRWQGAALLPIDQLVLSLAQDIFRQPVDLALAHKLALLLRQAANTHPDWRLPEFSAELAVIARNQRRFLGFSEEDTGIDPDKSPGTVFVCTVHKAKGMEWDRVYLMSVNNYDFPSGEHGDIYISEPWYIRDHLNLVAESLRQLDITQSQDEYEWYQEGEASAKARIDYVNERLRLLYVGITRARRELIVTWNSGRDGNLHPALPLAALFGYWEERYGEINKG